VPADQQVLQALLKLVHDLRTPLGVAVGYMRLLRDRRLPAEEDQQRAMSQSVDALAAMSRLCQDAASFAASSTEGDQSLQMIPAAQLTAEVAEHLSSPMALSSIDGDLSGNVRVKQGGATARAVAALLSRAGNSSDATPSTDIIVRVEGAHLNFLAGVPEQREAMLSGLRQVFDPWRSGPGLAVPLACLEVSQVSGHVFTDAAPSTAIAVVLPLETKD
jgi:signal transduction histidine kinase